MCVCMWSDHNEKLTFWQQFFNTYIVIVGETTRFHHFIHCLSFLSCLCIESDTNPYDFCTKWNDIYVCILAIFLVLNSIGFFLNIWNAKIFALNRAIEMTIDNQKPIELQQKKLRSNEIINSSHINEVDDNKIMRCFICTNFIQGKEWKHLRKAKLE